MRFVNYAGKNYYICLQNDGTSFLYWQFLKVNLQYLPQIIKYFEIYLHTDGISSHNCVQLFYKQMY